jgi:FdhD protein
MTQRARDGGATEREIVRVGPGGAASSRDTVVVEAPLALRGADGRDLTVTMRTPGHDLDLARGLLHAEGVLRGAEDVARVVRPPPGSLEPLEADNVIEVGLDPQVLAERFPARALAATAACGVCGVASIAALEVRAAPVHSDLMVPAALVADLPVRLGGAQEVFAATGGLHAAALFDPLGALLVVREDVGRHNAVDKVVGWALAAGALPLSRAILVVSGRLGFEIAQKAVMAGLPLVVAVSAPSSLAVDLAERFRVTLCGFTRGVRFNVYSHPARITPPWPAAGPAPA